MIKIFITLLLLIGSVFARNDVVYAIQLLSGKNRVSLKGYPSNCKLMRINSWYNIRCGPYKSYKKAKADIPKYRVFSTKPMVKKTYAFRFKKTFKKSRNSNGAILTTCRLYGFSNSKNRTYPWENIYIKKERFKIKKFPLVKTLEDKDLNTTKKISASNNSLLRFYTDVYLSMYNSQKNLQGRHLYGDSQNLKLGVQYSKLFFDHWTFFTDDRVILHRSRSNSSTKSGVNFEIKELYLRSFDLFENRANFLIGRKVLRDDRSWYYNSSLDTVGIFNKHDLLLYNIFAGGRLSKSYLFGNNIQSRHDLKNTKFVLANLSYQYYYDNFVKFYYLYENSDPMGQNKVYRNLYWLGGRAIGRYKIETNNIKYWFDLSFVNGTTKSISGQDKIDGFGAEVGALFNWGNATHSIGVSYAYGKGGKKRYLQSYLKSNKSNYLNNIINFRYYGEFLNPDLTNIHILSVYAILNKEESSDTLLALHNYRKDKKDDNIISNTYIFSPNGKSKDIGNEIDLIYKKEMSNLYYWKITLSYFLGGSAFDNISSKKDGFSASFNFRYYW